VSIPGYLGERKVVISVCRDDEKSLHSYLCKSQWPILPMLNRHQLASVTLTQCDLFCTLFFITSRTYFCSLSVLITIRSFKLETGFLAFNIPGVKCNHHVSALWVWQFPQAPLSGISGPSFDSPVLSPVLFFTLVLLLFLSCHFSANGPFSRLSPENSHTFVINSWTFFVWLLLSS